MLRHLPHHRQGFSSTLNHHHRARPPLPSPPSTASSCPILLLFFCAHHDHYAHASQPSTATILPSAGSSAPSFFCAHHVITAHMLLNPQPPPSRPPLAPLPPRSSAHLISYLFFYVHLTPSSLTRSSTSIISYSFFYIHHLLLVLLRPSSLTCSTTPIISYSFFSAHQLRTCFSTLNHHHPTLGPPLLALTRSSAPIMRSLPPHC
jgi:hypothetical protein